MNDSDVFFKAAEIIEKRGHAKHELQDAEGRVCLLGAIYDAVTGNPFGWWDVKDAQYCLPLYHTIFGHDTTRSRSSCVASVVDWNNAFERTPTEVIDALIHTGKMVKEREEGGF